MRKNKDGVWVVEPHKNTVAAITAGTLVRTECEGGYVLSPRPLIEALKLRMEKPEAEKYLKDRIARCLGKKEKARLERTLAEM
jgi:hypothetical protein